MNLTEKQKEVIKGIRSHVLTGYKKIDWAAAAEEDARIRQESIYRNEWIVDTKISDNGCSVEVSAVIKGCHGHRSWGWHDDGRTKHTVLSVSSLYQKVPVLNSIINLAEDEARRICRIKN